MRQECTVQASWPRRLIKVHFRVTDAWGRAIPSNPATVVCSERGEKGGAMIEATLLIRVPLFRRPSIRAHPQNFVSRGIRDPPQAIAPEISHPRTTHDA